MKNELEKYRSYIGAGLIVVATAYLAALNISDDAKIFSASQNIGAITDTLICGVTYWLGFKLIKK